MVFVLALGSIYWAFILNMMGQFAGATRPTAVVIILVLILCIVEGNLSGASVLLSREVASVGFVFDSGYSACGALSCCYCSTLYFVVIQ